MTCLLIVFIPKSWPNLIQINVICLSSASVVVYEAFTQPFISKLHNFLEFGNEFLILLIVYLQIGFSGIMDDFEAQYTIGWLVVSVFLFNFAFNFCFIFMQTCFKATSKLSNFVKKRKKKEKIS